MIIPVHVIPQKPNTEIRVYVNSSGFGSVVLPHREVGLLHHPNHEIVRVVRDLTNLALILEVEHHNIPGDCYVDIGYYTSEV